MAWTGLTLTTDGRHALNQAQLNNSLVFKSIVVGDGTAPTNFGVLKNLVHQLYELTDLKIDSTDEGCALTADFPSVAYDYYFREVGVIVSTDGGDKLYVYDNCGDDAQFIVNSTGAETTQKRLRLSLAISDVAQITATEPAVLYVDYKDFENEVSRAQASERANSDAIANLEQEITTALGGDPNFAGTITGALSEKVDKVAGKGLSANDFTNSMRDKLKGIAPGANNYVHPSTHPASMITGLPTSLPANGGNAQTVNGHTVNADVPAGAKFTDTVFVHPGGSGNKHIPGGGTSGQILRWGADGTAVWGPDNNTTYNNATRFANGLMSAADKSKLDDIESGANNYVHPGSHPASMISLDATRQFVTAAEKETWNSKAAGTAFRGATATDAGAAGLVPAPAAGKQEQFLRGDGTWQTVAVFGGKYRGFGYCSTGGAISEKSVQLDNSTTEFRNFDRVTVYFTETNSAAEPTIRFYTASGFRLGPLVVSGNRSQWRAGDMVDFILWDNILRELETRAKKMYDEAAQGWRCAPQWPDNGAVDGFDTSRLYYRIDTVSKTVYISGCAYCWSASAAEHTYYSMLTLNANAIPPPNGFLQVPVVSDEFDKILAASIDVVGGSTELMLAGAPTTGGRYSVNIIYHYL